jgi:hypothetical protein
MGVLLNLVDILQFCLELNNTEHYVKIYAYFKAVEKRSINFMLITLGFRVNEA